MLNVLRPVLSRALTPAGRILARTGVTPNVITVVGTVGVAAGALGWYPRGELLVGTIVIAVFVCADMLDGAVARESGRTGQWGAFLDSTMDRVADAAIFSGLVLWFIASSDVLSAALALACLVSGNVVSYARARAEGLGLRCDVGLAERGERLIVILVAAGLAGLGVPYALAVGLWVVAIASTVTVVQRLVAVHRQTGPTRPADRSGPRPGDQPGGGARQ